MTVLVRKINRAKWGDPLPDRLPQDIPADAITNCTRTDSNSLSFWDAGANVDGYPTRMDDVVTAIASAGDTLGRVDVVWLPIEDLKNDALVVLPTDAFTPFEAMAGFHCDAKFLTYEDLGSIGTAICAAISAGQFRRYSKSEVKRLLLTALLEGRLDRNRLSDSLRSKIIPSTP